jgi:hypothetical protein
MASRINDLEAKLQKAKDAYAKENYKYGQFSDKTFNIAKKQGVIKDKTQLVATRDKKEAVKVREIQVNRKNDLSKTAGRVALHLSMAKKKKEAAAAASKKKKAVK